MRVQNTFFASSAATTAWSYSRTTVRCSAFQCVLQCVAVCYSLLQCAVVLFAATTSWSYSCTTVRCSVLQCHLQQQKPGRTLALRCVAVCCGVLQCVAVSSVETAAWSYSRTTAFIFVRDITHSYVSHDSFTRGLQDVVLILVNTLQHTATHCKHTSKYVQDVVLSHYSSEAAILKSQLANKHTSKHTATHCNTLQHTATHCNTLQHSA